MAISEQFYSVAEVREKLASMRATAHYRTAQELNPRLVGTSIALDVDDGSVVYIDHDDAKVNDRLLRILGFNAKVLHEYAGSDGLPEQMVRHSLAKRPEKRLRVVHDETRVVSLLEESDPWVSPQDVFDRTIAQIGEEEILGIDHNLGSTLPSFKFVTVKSDHPARDVGDLTHAGVTVICLGDTVEIGPYTRRLICKNGLQATTTKLRFRLRLADRGEDPLPSAISTATRDAIAMVKDFVALAEKPIHEPPAVFISRLARVNRFPARMVTAVIDALPLLPPAATQYDLVNLVTSRFHVTGESRFEQMGWRVVREFKHEHCPQCSSALN